MQAHTLIDNPASAVAWLRSKGVQSLTSDSRLVETLQSPGFIAWPGMTVDGRQFVRQALDCGALACLVEHDASNDSPSELLQIEQLPVAAYKGLKAATGEIASLFYGVPSTHISVVAFTGTNGKTSSSWWLAQATLGAVVGTLGIGKIDQLKVTGLTTPDPVTLQAQLQRLQNQGCKVIGLEASSIGLAEGRLGGTHIHTAVFTNFTLDHLDYHGTMQAYWQAKSALFDWPGLKAAVINLDDPQGLVLLNQLTGQSLDVWTVALDRPARLTAQQIQTTDLGLRFNVVEEGISHSLQTNLIGRYNVSNLLGVIAAMRSLGLTLAACLEACGKITAVPGRLEVIRAQTPEQQPLAVVEQPIAVVDYAHTPDALEKALNAMRAVAKQRGGKLWCIFGCGGGRDASKRPIMGATARAHSDYVVVTSDNPRYESPSAIISQILLGLGEDTRIQVQADRARAIQETTAQAAPCDVILIAGKGHESYQEIEGERHAFSDQEHAKAALAVWRAAA